MNTEEGRRRLGQAIEQARLAARWGKERAAREAGISSITWANAERGDVVREEKMAAIESALGWPPGRSMEIRAGAAVGAEGDAASYVAAPGERMQEGTISEDQLQRELRELRQRQDAMDGKLDRIIERIFEDEP